MCCVGFAEGYTVANKNNGWAIRVLGYDESATYDVRIPFDEFQGLQNKCHI